MENLPKLNRMEADASKSLSPIALRTWNGSGTPDVQAATPPISNEIGVLAGPLYLAKPDRRRASRVEWTPWWNWWNSGRSRGWAAYERRLEVARAATADLRKHERVAARRAETARLRRAAA